MPLIKGKSKQAFDKNVESEMDSGKPQKQSLAIAYDIQRRNKKKKMMADGGEVESAYRQSIEAGKFKQSEMDAMDEAKRRADINAGKYKESMMADGGMVQDKSVADAVMRRRKAKMMADGGIVDLEENAKEGKNLLDDLNYEALKKENYSEQSALDDLDQPEDSNLHDVELSDADEHDMVESIRRKMKLKRGI